MRNLFCKLRIFTEGLVIKPKPSFLVRPKDKMPSLVKWNDLICHIHIWETTSQATGRD